MEYALIHLERRSPVAVIVIDNPKTLNALNAQTLAELSDSIEEAAADPAIRAVVVTGTGEKAFVAGADIREIAELSPEEGKAFALRGQHLFRRIETLGKPVIAAINGFALGGGCELALACTLRIAAETARLGQPEVKLGIMAGYGGSQRLPRLVGRSAALRLLLTGAMVDAREALRIGLVDEVVPQAELLARAEALAQEIAAAAPLAVTETLRAVDEGLDHPLDLALMREAFRFGHLCGSADMKEGTRAFLEKRKPEWTGR